MQRIQADLKFQCPFGVMIVGPPMSGKSYFTLELIRRSSEFLNTPPTRMVYAYGVWQSVFDNVNNVEFVKGVDGLSDIDFDPGKTHLLVIDDLRGKLCNNKELFILFTREMHHKNITVLFLVHNLFKQGASMRNVALSCQVMVLFKSPRDKGETKVLERQLDIKDLHRAYQTAIKHRYGYLVINLQPHIPDELRLQTGILDTHRRIYLKK